MKEDDKKKFYMCRHLSCVKSYSSEQRIEKYLKGVPSPQLQRKQDDALNWILRHHEKIDLSFIASMIS